MQLDEEKFEKEKTEKNKSAKEAQAKEKLVIKDMMDELLWWILIKNLYSF